MQEDEFRTYLLGQNLADRTRAQRVYALRRIERAHSIDLDEEFNRDQLTSLLRQFSYSAADRRAEVPNPSKLDIDLDKLLTHLAWYRSHISSYLRFRGGAIAEFRAEVADSGELSEISSDLIDEVVGKTFALERDLQSALRSNLAQLEAGLVVADGGAERRVEAGFIDILARDRDQVLTIIELKSETARPDAVAQTLAYMGCIAEETAEPVRGILVAGDHHPRVVHAARAVPNLMLKKYRFKFEFE
jgi:hypothetical protein